MSLFMVHLLCYQHCTLHDKNTSHKIQATGLIVKGWLPSFLTNYDAHSIDLSLKLFLGKFKDPTLPTEFKFYTHDTQIQTLFALLVLGISNYTL